MNDTNIHKYVNGVTPLCLVPCNTRMPIPYFESMTIIGGLSYSIELVPICVPHPWRARPNSVGPLAAGDGGGVNVGELVRVIREAALSRTEIQILTDALLNKHHDPLPEHSEWTEVSPTISNYSKSYFLNRSSSCRSTRSVGFLARS